MIRAALADARRIAGMRWSLGAPFVRLILASTASLQKEDARAVSELDAAAKGFDEVSMGLHAAISRWHLGRARGGDEGRALVTRAEEWMTSQGIASAPRIAGTLAPGFRR
jgi:hypothetical protein